MVTFTMLFGATTALSSDPPVLHWAKTMSANGVHT